MKTNKKLTKSGINRLIVIHLILLIQCVIFFSAAGHFNIKRAWIFFGLSFLFLIINTLIAIFFSPEIANVRGEMQKGTKTWDKVFIAVYTPMTLALPLIAGLVVGRFGWSYLGTGSLYAGIIIFFATKIWLSQDEAKKIRLFYLIVFLMGLDFAAHRLNSPFFPVLLILLIFPLRKNLRSPKFWGSAILIYFAGFSIHFYLLFRAQTNPQLDLGYTNTWGQFVSWILSAHRALRHSHPFAVGSYLEHRGRARRRHLLSVPDRGSTWICG